MTSIQNIDNITISDFTYYFRYTIKFIDLSEVSILIDEDDEDDDISFVGNAPYNHKWYGIAKIFCQKFKPTETLELIENLHGFYGSKEINKGTFVIQVKQ